MKDINDAVTIISAVTYNLWRASMCSGPKRITDLFEELLHPQIGDLVMEISTYGMKTRNDMLCIGTLVRIEYENTIPPNKLWVITLDFLDGREYRWENASFIKVKQTI